MLRSLTLMWDFRSATYFLSLISDIIPTSCVIIVVGNSEPFRCFSSWMVYLYLINSTSSALSLFLFFFSFWETPDCVQDLFLLFLALHSGSITSVDAWGEYMVLGIECGLTCVQDKKLTCCKFLTYTLCF